MFKFALTTLIGLMITVSAIAEEVAVPEGDAVAGKKVFNKCKACHSNAKGARHRVGPNLWGIVDKGIAEAEKYKYSKAYQAKKGELVWSEDVLFAYLEKPRTYIKGTKMVFPGLKKEKDRADLIAYLKTLKDAE